MDVTIRDATPADAPFLAWVMQTAARSHRPLSFWDFAFPGPDAPRLDYIAAMAVGEPVSFAHYSGFLVAEADGRAVAGLSAYDAATKGMDTFIGALASLMQARDWSPEHQELLVARMAPVGSCMPESPPGVWVIEWVAVRPEARGKGVAHALLLEILERGRTAGYTQSQIAYLLGNTPAQTAYERVGFENVDEKRDPAFEAAFGSPGIARMIREL
ncbi:MAG: GNAT family N-acetyltransferase [Myxococcales bacterium]|nr:MAG: GNAT family N-acetyltransferase [Myxococcales bacterium]